MNTKSRLSNKNRRLILKTGVATTVASSTPLLLSTRATAAQFTNAPTDGVVKLGLATSQSGAYADEGSDMLKAFELAVKHLNGEGDGGMINTMQPSSLQGNGILGNKVEFVSSDTKTRSSVAESSAKALIENEGVSMICGDISSSINLTMQSVCEDAGVIFMSGPSGVNSITGDKKSKYGFRHHQNINISSVALATSLVENLGSNRSAYYLYADYDWGTTTEQALRKNLEARGWSTVESVKTPVGAGDFTSYLEPVLESGADTLILVHYGKDMVNSVTQATQLGLPGASVNGKSFEMAIPRFSRLMAQGAGANSNGVYGTINWHWSLQDDASVAFTNSFGQEYGYPPSEVAHDCYVQALLYADACERAGSFDPCLVIAALEDHEFNGLGNGPAIYRGSDHQCFKDSLVVKGRAAPSSQYDLLEIVKTVPRATIQYDDTSDEFPSNSTNCTSPADIDTTTPGTDISPNTGADTAVESDTDTDTDTTKPKRSGGGAIGVPMILSALLAMSFRFSK